MRWADKFRDWCRGYSEADIDSALEKIEGHWTLPAGSIIPLRGCEMKALIGENMLGLFLHVRNMDFIHHPYKRKRGGDSSAAKE